MVMTVFIFIAVSAIDHDRFRRFSWCYS
jgi:hypothetical protein